MTNKAKVRTPIAERVNHLPWEDLRTSLHDAGFALTPQLLTADECMELRNLYSNDELFRSHVIMERLRFGRGDYKYFNYPLPKIVGDLRSQVYPRLAILANEWAEELASETRFPDQH